MQPLSEHDFAAALEPDIVSTEEMRDLLMRQLHASAVRGELKGVALVQGLKALDSLLKSEKAEPPKADADERFSILDRVDALPPEHARGLVQAEIERLRTELDGLHAALTRLGE